MARAKLIFWIVVYAVILGLSVSYCVRSWMPQEVLNWVLWGVGVVLAMVAIAHIASFAKLLGKAYENNEE